MSLWLKSELALAIFKGWVMKNGLFVENLITFDPIVKISCDQTIGTNKKIGYLQSVNNLKPLISSKLS